MSQAAIPLFKVFMPDDAYAALEPVLASGRLACGPQVAAFENELANWLGVPHCVALNDASGALTMALYLAGVRPGDEVISSPLACAASLMPIANLFATPVWCDINPATGMPGVDDIARCITPRTKAILLYHWSGNVADVQAIKNLAQTHGIQLIEDATEALGASLQQQRLGAVADFTVYSFYATKPLNTGGEGAALVVRDAAATSTAIQLRRFGIDYPQLRLGNGDLNPHFDIPLAGFNLAMNEIAATIGRRALPHMNRLIARHQANGQFYDEALQSIDGIEILAQTPGSLSAYWTYSLVARERDRLLHRLLDHGIAAQRLHVRNDGYRCFPTHQQALPGVAELDAHNLSIPCGWWVTDTDRERIVACLRQSG
jgi:perosamine synthetase